MNGQKPGIWPIWGQFENLAHCDILPLLKQNCHMEAGFHHISTISQRCELISSNIFCVCVSFFAAQTANCASGYAVGPETTPTSLVSSISHFLYTNSAENGAPGYIWCSFIQSWSDLLYKVLHPPISLVVQTSTWFLLFFHHLKSNSLARQINANKPT